MLFIYWRRILLSFVRNSFLIAGRILFSLVFAALVVAVWVATLAFAGAMDSAFVGQPNKGFRCGGTLDALLLEPIYDVRGGRSVLGLARQELLYRGRSLLFSERGGVPERLVTALGQFYDELIRRLVEATQGLYDAHRGAHVTLGTPVGEDD